MLYFLSYSRNELLFAEWLKYELNPSTASKLEIWFDLERLDVGESWEEQREIGLDRCAGVILIASKAAMVSPQVEYEWRYALNDKKPIIIVWFERVKLPPELADAPAINLATLNRDKVEQFRQVLLEQAPAYDSSPLALMGISLSVPASTRRQLLYLLRGWFIYTVFAGVVNFLYPNSTILVALLLFVGIWSLIAVWLLLNRVRFSRISRFLSWAVFSNRVLGVLLALSFCIFALPATVRTVKPTRAEEMAYVTGLFIGIYAMHHAVAPDGFWWRKNMLAWVIKGQSRSGGGMPNRPPVIEDFIWFNRVDQSPLLRQARGNRYNHNNPSFPHQVLIRYGENKSPKTYSVFISDKKRRWAERVHTAMRQHDHTYIDPDKGASHVNYDIVILSREWTPENIERVRQRGNKLITVVIDNVDMKRFPGLLDHQVVDMRSWNVDLLEGLAYRLTGTSGGKRAFAIQVDPRKFDANIRPPINSMLAFYGLPSLSSLAGMTSIIVVSFVLLYFLLSGSFSDLARGSDTLAATLSPATISPTETVPLWRRTELPFGVDGAQQRLTQIPLFTRPASPTSPIVIPEVTPPCFVVIGDGEMLPCDE